jgi:hypothetical protein
MRARERIRQIHDDHAEDFRAERLERSYLAELESADAVLRQLVTAGTPVELQSFEHGVKVWLREWLNPDTDAIADRDLTMLVAVVLDLDWLESEETIPALEPRELARRLSEHLFGGPDVLRYELR